MVDRICVVLEGLSIAVCLHRLYGKKFRFDIATVSLMTIEMIMMQAIDYFGWPKELSMLFYPIIVVYCVIEFGFKWKELIINNVLNAIIICTLQIVVMMIIHMFEKQKIIIGMQSLLLNCIILIILVFLLPKLRVSRLTILLIKDREKLLIASLILGIIITILCLFSFKRINIITFYELLQRILFSICILMMGLLILRLGKYKIKSKEIEIELKMHKLYASSFDNLVDNIRSRQHEFDNHINTIYSQHYIYKTYTELVEAQKNYCMLVTAENRFNKLLFSGNSIILGFLYSKFIEIDRLGIDISYHINIEEFQVEIPTYKIIEILGNLIGNAEEELRNTEIYNKLYVYMKEKNKKFTIEVRNECNYINYTEIELFFTKGYSKKGENRGLGLFHVKSICDEYKLSLSCQNKDIDESNWISFTISNIKETT